MAEIIATHAGSGPQTAEHDAIAWIWLQRIGARGR